ncbi:MAG TPA: RNA 3'-terminal phosphate cyclase [Candidatus Nanoarchaeia archaeon]|nr:RNA 3'-terminal phosphate cyclase [Candidatus Nanoarchaeia archaeon]
MITIDGTNGGGQVLRTALSLSAITQQPFLLQNIRGARPKPGMGAQHVMAVKAASDICHASAEGAKRDSMSLRFMPGKIKGGSFSWDIGTAGSTTLILQTVLPILFYADGPSKITIRGGTDTEHALPSLDARDVFLDVVCRMNLDVDMSIDSFGFFPKGQGQITATIVPNKRFSGVHISNRGLPERLQVTAVVSKDLQGKKVAERMVQAFMEKVVWVNSKEVKEDYVTTADTGGFLHAHTHFTNTVLGATVLAEKKKSAEHIGYEVAALLNQELASAATVDGYTADQLMVYFALAGDGSCKVREITDHMRSNAAVIEQFLPVKFTFENNELKVNTIKSERG